MHVGLQTLFMALAISQPPRESFQSANFVVYAESAAIARQVAEAAEKHRAALATRWVGKALPNWSEPCSIEVTLSDRPGGATDISYVDGKVLFQKVRVSGPVERILKGPLPHELTHLMFGHFLGFRAPRWADEGGAILAEDEATAKSHRRALQYIFDARTQYPLREFLGMEEYPADVRRLYAQGHSVASFLVAAKGHQVFLSFLRDGRERGWDSAVRNRYCYENVEQLEAAWLQWARAGK